MKRALLAAAVILALAAGRYGPTSRAQAVEPEVYPVYVNTGELEAPVPLGADGLPLPMEDRIGKDAELEVPVLIPEHALGIVGWRLSLFAKDRTSHWLATLKLKANGLGVDHLKGRETDSGQGDAVMLPSLLQIRCPCTGSLLLSVFNEDGRPVKVRANAWIYFAVAD